MDELRTKATGLATRRSHDAKAFFAEINVLRLESARINPQVDFASHFKNDENVKAALKHARDNAPNYKERDRASKRWSISRDLFDLTFPLEECSKHFLDRLATFADENREWPVALEQLERTRRVRQQPETAKPGVPRHRAWVPSDIPPCSPEQPRARKQQRSNPANSSHQSSNPLLPSAHNPPAPLWASILWILVPDNPPLADSPTLPIEYFTEDHAALGHDPWLTESTGAGLGKSAVIKSPGADGSICMHQGLVTMLAARSLMSPPLSSSIRLHEWSWLTERIQKNDLLATCRDADGQPQNTIIFVVATTDEPADMRHVYDAIRLQQHIHGAELRPYPSEAEWAQETMKLGDIRLLDEIARAAPAEEQHSFRPLTCFGHGPCRLAGHEKTVNKRTHSGSAKHVNFRGMSDQELLTCTRETPPSPPAEPAPQSKKRKRTQTQQQKPAVKKAQKPKPFAASGPRSHWFHQEFVPSLYKGEFRVFIATAPDARGLRGLRGRVVTTAWTAWIWPDSTLASRAAMDNDFSAPLTRAELERFALYVFEELRRRGNDGTRRYESLEVGVRLDVGVGGIEGGKQQFFVNEITRWYNGHYFSNNILPEPKTHICRAFAEAFARYIQPRDG